MVSSLPSKKLKYAKACNGKDTIIWTPAQVDFIVQTYATGYGASEKLKRYFGVSGDRLRAVVMRAGKVRTRKSSGRLLGAAEFRKNEAKYIKMYLAPGGNANVVSRTIAKSLNLARCSGLSAIMIARFRELDILKDKGDIMRSSTEFREGLSSELFRANVAFQNARQSVEAINRCLAPSENFRGL